MTHRKSRRSISSQHPTGNAAMGTVLALGLFGVVLGALYLGSQVTPVEEFAESTTGTGPTAVVPADVVRVADAGQATASGVIRAGEELVLDELEPVPPAEALELAEAQQAAVAPAGVLERVEAYLAAGEFNPALELALEVADVELQQSLLNRIAEAQWQSGEFDFTFAAIRRGSQEFSAGEQTQAAQASSNSLAGGAGGADFGPLMDLIQNQTSGPWIDVEGTGGSMSPFGDTTGGVSVDPNGVMAHLQEVDRTQRLASVGWMARRADLNEDMSRSSDLRLVSLTRLERQLAERLVTGQPVLETMRHLAGLTSVRYVFVLPEQGEILIGGPAEGWKYNESGMPLGDSSGRPTLQLDDLVTVMRTFSDDGAQIFTCSIDPRPEGLQELKSFLDRTNGQSVAPAAMRQRVKHYQQLLGLQDVTIKGVPVDSRIARVIAEADYRMKLIGIGKLDSGVPSFFDLLAENSTQLPQSMDALRWWLTMKYDAVLYSQDRDVFEIQGSSVQCLSENEYINQQGQRVQSGQSEPTNREFARRFTEHYSQLAAADPVFADLQNVFDLSLVAALLQREQLARRIDWNYGAFAGSGAYRTEAYEAPQAVMSVVNHRVYNGKDVVIQVAGGVRGDLLAVVRDNQTMRPGVRLDGVRQRAESLDVPANRWWWDAR